MFYSRLHGRTVVDAAGLAVGRLDDLAVNVADTFPPVTALVVRRGRLEPFPLTARWRDVAAVDGVVRLAVPVGRLVPGRALQSEHEFWVRSTLLDRQIVDTAGAKVVRVNDLHFLRVASGDLHLVHVDVGFRGLVRRLGWDDAIDAAVRRLSPRARYLSSERLISWRYVQPLALSGSGDALRLSLPRGELAELHPAELADVLSDLDGRERESVFRALATDAAAEALTEVEPKIREQLIGSVPPEHAADILEEMPPDEAADLLAALPEQESELLLQNMERAEAREVAELLRYEPDTAGGMMTTELVALSADLSCAEALERLRSLAAEGEFIYYLYVVDAGHRLRGVITIRQLLVGASATPLETIMERDLVFVHPDDTRERVAEVVEKYNLLAVPVLDAEERLLGIVTVDDVLTHMTALAWKWKLGRKR
ncbi:MAG TPA: CBS domain-containing protein [Candidatus Binatia bacterium]|nr:CBS domain-containing protein [Candidatus Binatia bacterium]